MTPAGPEQPRPIVLGIERSERSRDGLALATMLGGTLDAPLLLVSVYPVDRDPPAGAVRAYARALEAEAESALEVGGHPARGRRPRVASRHLHLRRTRPAGHRAGRRCPRDRGRAVAPGDLGPDRPRQRRRAAASRRAVPGRRRAPGLLGERSPPDRADRGRLHLRTGRPSGASTAFALAEQAGATLRIVSVLEPPAVTASIPAGWGYGDLDATRRGRVAGVYAAGDATTFPIKQGGLATQQADAVAEAIAADIGVRPQAAPFRPILRGLLLTGGAPLYLRAELVGPTEATTALTVRGQASGRALWWPPGKVAGRYLAPYLADARPVDLAAEPLVDRAASRNAPAPDRDDAFELALLLAEEDARMGDYRQALHALDAAAALSGGVLPDTWAENRSRWQRELARTG